MPKAHQQQFPQAPPLLGPLQPLATEEHAKSTIMTGALIVEVEGDCEEDGEQPGETKESVEEVLLQPERGNRSAQWSRCQLGCSGSQNLPGSNYRRIICSCSYYMEHAKILI